MASNETHYVLDRPSFDKPVKLLIVVSPYYKQIADQLQLSTETVNTHKKNMKEKSGLKTTAELIKLGIDLGLV